MLHWFEIWMGSRYVRARSSNRFVSMISAISMLGIAIAVAVLIIVMSVVNGFSREWPHLTGGGAHSDQLRLVERYTRSEDGSWLNLEFTADDPAIFAEPYTVLRRWLATPDEIIAEEEECIGVAGQP